MPRQRDNGESRIVSGIIGVVLLLVAFGAMRFGLLAPLGRMLVNHSMEVRHKIGKKNAKAQPPVSEPPKADESN